MTDIIQSMRIPVDLQTGITVQMQRAKLMKGDKKANRIVAVLSDGGKAVDLTGCTAAGGFYRPSDRAEIRLEGEIAGNEASVQLKDACYAESGSYELRIKLIKDEVERTILCIAGEVHASGSGAYLDVDNVIPSIDDIIAQYQTMQQVTEEAREAARNAEVWAEASTDAKTLEAGEEAYVTVTDVDGVRYIQFGIPRGQTGPQGIPGISPEISVQKINGGHRVTVKDAQGEKSFEILDGSTAKVSYVRIPFSILTGSAWNYNADGIYELNIQVPDMPESDGDVFLDVSGISSANAQAYRDEYRKIWSVKTYAGGVTIQALSVPMMDLKMIAGVFVWAT